MTGRDLELGLLWQTTSKSVSSLIRFWFKVRLDSFDKMYHNHYSVSDVDEGNSLTSSRSGAWSFAVQWMNESNLRFQINPFHPRNRLFDGFFFSQEPRERSIILSNENFDEGKNLNVENSWISSNLKWLISRTFSMKEEISFTNPSFWKWLNQFVLDVR